MHNWVERRHVRTVWQSLFDESFFFWIHSTRISAVMTWVLFVFFLRDTLVVWSNFAFLAAFALAVAAKGPYTPVWVIALLAFPLGLLLRTRNGFLRLLSYLVTLVDAVTGSYNQFCWSHHLEGMAFTICLDGVVQHRWSTIGNATTICRRLAVSDAASHTASTLAIERTSGPFSSWDSLLWLFLVCTLDGFIVHMKSNQD